jgi:hypothetical protein
MAGINSIWGNYNSNSYLFGNVNTSNTSSGNILGIDFAEYSSITKGSYSKLIKAYYKKYGTEKSADGISTKDKDTTATKTSLKGKANELYKAADTLVTTGKDSVFKKIDIKNEEDGTTTKGYDTDKIYKAVNSFVDAYNSLVKNSTDSKDNAVLRQTLHMVNSASANGSLLNDIGIKIGTDNTLTLDEETFKSADMNKVKTLFNGSDSFGARVQSAASSIYLNVNNSLGDSNSYTAAGTLGSYSTGNILDSLL